MEWDFCDKWKEGIMRTNKNKLRTYARFKDQFYYEKYLDDVKNNNHRIALTRIRTGSHFLRIETGRFSKNEDVKARVCKHCDSGDIEDEHHFVTTCGVNTMLIQREN